MIAMHVCICICNRLFDHLGVEMPAPMPDICLAVLAAVLAVGTSSRERSYTYTPAYYLLYYLLPTTYYLL